MLNILLMLNLVIIVLILLSVIGKMFIGKAFITGDNITGNVYLLFSAYQRVAILNDSCDRSYSMKIGSRLILQHEYG